MNNYYYELVDNDDTFIWNVVETQTGYVIREFFFEEDAIELTDRLMDGHGFDGYTPAFFLE